MLRNVLATPANASTCGRSASGPNAQLRPTTSGSAWRTECQNASGVCPESVRPLASVMVPEIINGSGSRSANTSSSANSAALAFKVSNTVSIRIRSTPPATSPAAASRYACASSSKRTLRAPGSLTSGEMLAVRLVGPSTPATQRGFAGVANAAAARRAMAADSKLSSAAASCKP